MEEKIRALKDRKVNYEAWKKEFAESRATQKLLTDPQARMMHTTKDGYHCCYNVQTAVSAQGFCMLAASRSRKRYRCQFCGS